MCQVLLNRLQGPSLVFLPPTIAKFRNVVSRFWPDLRIFAGSPFCGLSLISNGVNVVCPCSDESNDEKRTAVLFRAVVPPAVIPLI
jgi:hypothetical protein